MNEKLLESPIVNNSHITNIVNRIFTRSTLEFKCVVSIFIHTFRHFRVISMNKMYADNSE